MKDAALRQSVRTGILALLLPLAVVSAAEAACDCAAEVCSGNGASYARDGETIAFAFDCDGGDCACGKFANEWDYWVAPLSPGQTITITQMTPAQTGSGSSLRNGAELNPGAPSAQGLNGFDGPFPSVRLMPSYSAALTVTPPFAYDAAVDTQPDVIVKSISAPDASCGGNTIRVCHQYVETLTLLPSAPAQPVFRPPYFGETKPPLIPASAFDDSFLSSLSSVGSSPSWQSALDTLQSVHLEHTKNWNARQGMHSWINHGGAGRGYESVTAYDVVTSLIKLNEAAPSAADQDRKRKLALAAAQHGIDLYAIHQSETPCFTGWPATGGFGGGKLPLIIYAANLLDRVDWIASLDAAMSGDIIDRNCFNETGYVQPALGFGKDVPLFGLRPSNKYAGSDCVDGTNQNCASGFGGTGSYDALSDGDLTGASGSPTQYQSCCTHGFFLGGALSYWLNPRVRASIPPTVQPFLTYTARARSLGVSHGEDFGTYDDRASFASSGFNSGYDSSYIYDMWNTYKACADAGTCPGLGGGSMPGDAMPPARPRGLRAR